MTKNLESSQLRSDTAHLQARSALALLLIVLLGTTSVDTLFELDLFNLLTISTAITLVSTLVALLAALLYRSADARAHLAADTLLMLLMLGGVALIYREPLSATIWLPLLLVTPVVVFRHRSALFLLTLLGVSGVLTYALAVPANVEDPIGIGLLILSPLCGVMLYRLLQSEDRLAWIKRSFVPSTLLLASLSLLAALVPNSLVVNKVPAVLAFFIFLITGLLAQRRGENEWVRAGLSLLLLIFYSIVIQLTGGQQAPGVFLVILWLFTLLPVGQAILLSAAAIIATLAGVSDQIQGLRHPTTNQLIVVSGLFSILLYSLFTIYSNQRLINRHMITTFLSAALVVVPVLMLLDFQSTQRMLNGELNVDWYFSKLFVGLVVTWLVARLISAWRAQLRLEEELAITNTARNWALKATETVVLELNLETGFADFLGGKGNWGETYLHKPLMTMFAEFLRPADYEAFRQLQQQPYEVGEFSVQDPNTSQSAMIARFSFSQSYLRDGQWYQMLYRQDISELRRLQLEAQSALAKLESLTEALEIGLFEHELATGKYAVNSSWRKLRDLPQELYPEMDFEIALQGLPSTEHERHLQFVKKVHAEGGLHSTVQRFTHRDGSDVWLKLVVKPIYLNGVMIKVVGCNIDVTEDIAQKKALEQLNKQQQILVKELKDELITNHLMGRVAGLGRFVYDPREKSLELSAEAMDLLGVPYKRAQMSDLIDRCSDKDAHSMVSFANRIGLLSINYISREDVEAGRVKTTMRGSQIESEPVELVDNRGRSTWVKLTAASYQLDNEPVDVVGCVLDVTDEAREQRKSEDRFYELKKAAEAANIHVYEENLTTNEGMLITDPTRYPTGTSTPLVGKQLTELVPPDYHIELERFYEAVGYIAEFPVDLPSASGRVWFKQQVVRRFKRGGADRAVVIAIDVTSEHQIKALLESSLNESEALIREMREQRERQRRMFAVIGHELRTPAATLRMLLDDQSVAALSPHGPEIDDVTNHLLAVLDDLRSVVRPEGSEIGEISEDSPEKLFQRALGPLKALFAEHRLNTHINTSKVHYTELTGNYQALRQIITNLAKNSALYSGASDLWITASTRALEDERIMLEVRVEDNGKGIDAEVVDKLFGAFSRGESDKDGTGLGLFISRDLARKMGGDVSYSEREGGGACFELTALLRLPGARAFEQAPERVISEDLLQGKRVLVAEDNKMLQMLTRKLIEKLGAEVEVAENGMVALERAEVADFDLVMSDIFMPEMDGYTLARSLRKRDARLPIIGVSAATIGEETDQMLASGADRVIAKPLSVEALLQAYADILQERMVLRD